MTRLLKLNKRQDYLLRFLYYAQVISPELVFALLNEMGEKKGQAIHFGCARSFKNSYLYVSVRRLRNARILRKHAYGDFYMLGRRAWPFLEDIGAIFHGHQLRRARGLGQSNPGLGQVKHDCHRSVKSGQVGTLQKRPLRAARGVWLIAR